MNFYVSFDVMRFSKYVINIFFKMGGVQWLGFFLRWVGFSSWGNGCRSKKRVNLVLLVIQVLFFLLQGGYGLNEKYKMMLKC